MAAVLVGYGLVASAGLLSVPIAVLLAEVVASSPASRRQPPWRALAPGPRPTVAVLVPAHNEGRGLLPTIGDIKAQLADGDRLVVVADNCNDDTAAVARAAGAEVVERNDLSRVGKGYALNWGTRCLDAAPPEIVIMVDADCRLGDAAIDRLARTAAATGRPVQALDLMLAPDGSAIDHKVAEFAWRVKNWVRPLGLSALNLPCQLMGTGMAFPWAVIGSASLAGGHIVEDLKLGLDLARAGHLPLFCPSALVTSRFPSSVEAARGQRERWEHGHVATSLSALPHLLAAAWHRRSFALLALALDVVVPPLTLLGLLAAAMLAVAGVAALLGASVWALWVSTANIGAFSLAVLLAWIGFGREVLPAAALVSIGAFVWAKLPIYGRLMRGPVAQWIRTDRK